MKLSSYKNLVVERSNEFIKDGMAGVVIRTAEEIGDNVYGIYIGRMMMGVRIAEGPIEKQLSLNSSKCLNSINKNVGEKSATASNFIHLTMHSLYNISMPRLILGENVIVGLIDQDIKSMYIRPFSRDKIKYRPNDILEMYVPASGKFDGEDLTDDNTYYVRCDSVNKAIRIHMSKANGEVSAYDITIDGTNGTMSMTDGKRSIILNTNDDEVILSNEKGSTVSLRKEMIDILCKKLYIKAEDSFEIECPKTKAKLDNIELTAEDFKGKVKSLKLEGDKLVEKYSKTQIENDKRQIKSSTTEVDGLVTVSGWIGANKGIGFGTQPGKAPLPTIPQISGSGMANFSGPSGMCLVKAPPLVQILTQMLVLIDIAGSAPIVPPTAVATVTPMLNQLLSTVTKG